MQTVTVANTGSSTTWTNGSPSYSLTFNGSDPTACLVYDAEDWEMEVTRIVFVFSFSPSLVREGKDKTDCSTAPIYPRHGLGFIHKAWRKTACSDYLSLVFKNICAHAIACVLE